MYNMSKFWSSLWTWLKAMPLHFGKPSDEDNTFDKVELNLANTLLHKGQPI